MLFFVEGQIESGEKINLIFSTLKHYLERFIGKIHKVEFKLVVEEEISQ